MQEEEETQALVRRAQAGDLDACGEIYDAFAPRVFRFFRFRVPADEAEDLMQRVFLKMVEQLPNYRYTGSPFAAWLFRMARNALIDASRTDRPDLPLEQAAERAAEYGNPESQSLSAMDGAQLRRAVDALPREQRDVIVYRFFAGLSSLQTAALMGKSEGSVRAMQFRAIEGLRRRLVAEDGLPNARPEVSES